MNDDRCPLDSGCSSRFIGHISHIRKGAHRSGEETECEYLLYKRNIVNRREFKRSWQGVYNYIFRKDEYKEWSRNNIR